MKKGNKGEKKHVHICKFKRACSWPDEPRALMCDAAPT